MSKYIITFKKFDLNNSGFVSTQDIIKALSDFGITFKQKDLEKFKGELNKMSDNKKKIKYIDFYFQVKGIKN